MYSVAALRTTGKGVQMCVSLFLIGGSAIVETIPVFFLDHDRVRGGIVEAGTVSGRDELIDRKEIVDMV